MTENIEVLLTSNGVEFKKAEEPDRTIYFCDWKIPSPDMVNSEGKLLGRIACSGFCVNHVTWSTTEPRLYFRVTVRASKGRKALNA